MQECVWDGEEWQTFSRAPRGSNWNAKVCFEVSQSINAVLSERKLKWGWARRSRSEVGFKMAVHRLSDQGWLRAAEERLLSRSPGAFHRPWQTALISHYSALTQADSSHTTPTHTHTQTHLWVMQILRRDQIWASGLRTSQTQWPLILKSRSGLVKKKRKSVWAMAQHMQGHRWDNVFTSLNTSILTGTLTEHLTWHSFIPTDTWSFSLLWQCPFCQFGCISAI